MSYFWIQVYKPPVTINVQIWILCSILLILFNSAFKILFLLSLCYLDLPLHFKFFNSTPEFPSTLEREWRPTTDQSCESNAVCFPFDSRKGSFYCCTNVVNVSWFIHGRTLQVKDTSLSREEKLLVMALNFFGKGLAFEFGLNNSRKIRDWQPGVLHECVRGTNRIIKNHLAFIPFTHPFLFSSSAYLPKLTFKKENFCDFISSVYNLFNAIKTDKVLISRREWYAITGGYPQPLYNNWETYKDFRPKFDGGSVTCRKWTNLYLKTTNRSWLNKVIWFDSWQPGPFSQTNKYRFTHGKRQCSLALPRESL